MDEIRHLGTDLIGDYAEGLLDPAARSGADRHLQSCDGCRRELESVQAYFRDMAGLEPHRAPDRFLSRVHGRIAKASPWRRLLGILSSPRLLPVPVAALSVILLGVYFAYVSRSALEPETTVAYAPAAPGAASEDVETREAKLAPLPEKPAKDAAPVPEITLPAAPPAEAPVTVTMSQPKAPQRVFAKKAAPRPRGDAAAKVSNQDIVALLEKKTKKEVGESERFASGGSTRLAGRRSIQAAGSVAAEAEVPPKGSDQVLADEGAGLAMAPAPAPASATPSVPAVRSEPKAKQAYKADNADDSQAALAEEPQVDMADEPIKAGESQRASAKASPPIIAYTVNWPFEGSDDSSFKAGLADLGIRILSRPSHMAGEWTLEVRSKRIPELEELLRRTGKLTERKTFISDGNGEKPIRLKVLILSVP